MEEHRYTPAEGEPAGDVPGRWWLLPAAGDHGVDGMLRDDTSTAVWQCKHTTGRRDPRRVIYLDAGMVATEQAQQLTQAAVDRALWDSAMWGAAATLIPSHWPAPLALVVDADDRLWHKLADLRLDQRPTAGKPVQALDEDAVAALIPRRTQPPSREYRWREPLMLPDVAELLFLSSLTHWVTLSSSCVMRCSEVKQPAGAVPQEAVLTAVGAAQQVSRAAYAARDSVVHDPPEVSRGVVARFTSDWLGFRPTRDLVDAAGNALLFAPLDPDGGDGLDSLDLDDEPLLRRLKAATRAQHRALRPVTDTQLCYQLVDSLDPPLRTDDPLSAGLTVGSTVAGDNQIDTLLERIGGFTDPRVDRVLARLTPAERRVALVYANTDKLSDTVLAWEDAATLCGWPRNFGVRVQRKLRREGRRLLQLAAATPHRRRRVA